MTGRYKTRRCELCAAVLAAASLLAGCGGSDPSAAPPMLPRSLGLELARTSQAVAASLAVGNRCRALTLARSLRQRTLAAVDTGRVPVALQRPLRTAVNGLATRIHCSPPPTPSTAGSVPAQLEEHGKGKHKGHEKHGKGKHGKEHD